MDLWIRSQDRKTISKANKIYMEHNEDRMYNINIYDDYSNTLATYKTKERALEVLDEIQEILKPRTIIKFENRPHYLEDGIISDVLAPKECLDYNKQLINYVYEDVNMDVGHWFEEIKSIVTKEQFNSVKYEV